MAVVVGYNSAIAVLPDGAVRQRGAVVSGSGEVMRTQRERSTESVGVRPPSGDAAHAGLAKEMEAAAMRPCECCVCECCVCVCVSVSVVCVCI